MIGLHIEVPYICSATYGGPIPNDMVAQRFPIFGYDKKNDSSTVQFTEGLKTPSGLVRDVYPEMASIPTVDIQCHLLRFGIWTPEICITKSKPQKVFSCLGNIAVIHAPVCFGLC